MTVVALTTWLHKVRGLPLPLLRSPWSVEDVAGELGRDEVPRLIFPVRYREGRLPYFLLAPGPVLVLTDRRVLAFRCARATWRIEERMWRDDTLELAPGEGGDLELLVREGEVVGLRVHFAYRADLGHWVRKLRHGEG
ncbi:hypothetical protein [Streptomyces triticagri]|uniref:hypothetical protein n=1 Tax=Streptomyces triticagri TaxID=2293568 RepID=UPI000FFB69D9|nr:hypothetical protein [Streptomyces triticagri]